jgi:hypothetical protein
MMWLAFAIVIICLIVLLRNKPQGAPMIHENSEQHEILLPSTITELEADEDVIAVITAAIHEFTGTGEFQVVKIKPSATNWVLTGRQNLLANR